MNAKEKAKDLVEQFTFICQECDYDWNAKQSALIAVDEIIKVSTNSQNSENYWRQVKQEIENL